MASDDDILSGFGKPRDPGQEPPSADDGILEGFGPTDPRPAIVGNTTTPAQGAEALKISKETGVHPSVVAGNPDYFKNKQKQDSALETVQGSQFLSDYVTGLPHAAAVSDGDWQAMDNLGKTVDQWVRGGGLLPDKLRDYLWAPEKFLKEAAQIDSQATSEWLASSHAPDFWERHLAFPKFLGREGMAALNIAGAGIAPMFEAGDDFLKLLGLDETQRLQFWLMAGFGLHGKFKLKAEDGLITLPSEEAISTARPKATNRDTREEMAFYYADKMGIDRPIIRGLSDNDLNDFLRRNDPSSQAAKDMNSGGVDPPKGADKVFDAQKAVISELDAKSLDQAFKAVQATQTKARSPEAVEAFLEHEGLLRGKDLWVDAHKIRELYGTDQPAIGDDKFGYIPNIGQRLADAEAMGTEINLPRGAFLAYTSESTYGAIKPFIRLQDNGLATEEISSIMDRHDPEHEVAKEPILEEKSGLEPTQKVPTAEELAAEGMAEIERKAQAEAEAKPEGEEGEAEGLAPGVETEMRPALNRAEAESIANHGLYDPKEWSPSDFAPSKQEIKGQPGANTARLAKLLGPKLYGEPTHMTSVTVKELMQNAFDAIKAILDKDPNYPGQISIQLNKNERTVTMTDNGTGMSPQVLAKEFMEIAGTNKETKNASGGLGIAKMLTLFGNKGLHVITMRDGVVSELTTHGEELFSALQDPSLAPTIKTRAPTASDYMLFPNKSGSHVEVTIPETYKDTSTGEEKRIEFSTWKGDYAALKRSPLFGNIDVRFNPHAEFSKDPGEIVPIGKNFPAADYRPFFTVNFDWGEAVVYVSNEPKDAYWGQNTHILSNGIWQFSVGLKKNPLEPFGDDVPVEVYVDVKPKVSPEDAGYPIDLNRQGFTADAKKAFDQIFAHISGIYRDLDIRQGVEDFGTVQYLTPGKAGVEVSEPKKLMPEKKEQKGVARLGEGEKITVKDGKLKVGGRVIPDISQKLAETQLKPDELLVPKSMIDPKKVMLQNSLEVRVPGAGGAEYMDLLEQARAIFGSNVDQFLFEVGDVFKRLRDSLPKLMGKEYNPLLDEAIGISFDTKYRGVSIRVPFSGSFVNPAQPEFADPTLAAIGTWGTMVHELAHHKVRSHNADFPAEMQRIQIYIDMAQILHDEMKGGDVINKKGAINALIQTYKRHETIFKWLRDATSYKAEAEGRVKYRGLRIKGTDEPTTPGSSIEGTGDNESGLSPSYQRTGEEGENKGDFANGPVRNDGATGKGFLLAGTGTQLAAAILNATKKSLYLAPTFGNNKEAMMSKSEFNLWSQRLQERENEQYEKALAAAKKEVEKRLTPEWEHLFMEKAQEVESDLYSSPNIAAYRFLKFGELPGQPGETVPPKLDRKAVEYMAGEKAISSMTVTGGQHPDNIAPTFGFASGKEMVDALVALEKGRGKTNAKQYIKDLVAEAANHKLSQEYGSIEEAIAEEAQKIALENSQVDWLVEELRHLAKMTGQMPFTKAQMQKAVEDIFGRTPVREAKYQNYANATFKNGEKTKLALLKQDPVEAFKNQLHRIYSILGAKEAKAFESFQKSSEKMFTRVAHNNPIKTVDPEHFLQAAKILADIGRGPQRTAPRDGLKDFVDNSGSIDVAPWLYDQSLRRADMKFDNLTVDEYTALANSIKSILHNGREHKLVGGVHDKAEMDNVIFDIKKEFEEVGPNGKPRFPDIPIDYVTLRQKIGGVARYVNSMNLLVERMFDYTDRFHPDGPITRYLDRPLREAFNEELKLTEATVKKLKSMQQYVDSSINDIIDNKVIKFRGENRILTRQNMRYMLLHMGSRSGMQKITEGFNIKEDEAWDLIAKNATENDIKWANSMWELHENLWRRGADMERRVKGVEPDKIEAEPKDIVLADGSKHHLTGGYTPVKYDKAHSQHSQEIERKNTAKLVASGLFNANYVQALTPSKWTIPRTDYAAPLDITGAMYVNHLTGMIHDIAFREAVLSTRKLLLNDEFREVFRRKWGKEYDSLLDGWLKDIANAQNNNDDLAQGLAHGIAVTRNQIISALTSGNLSTVLKHGTS
ncbi:MAG TPA: ATP-binding protein, partial [Candidatus Bathyarchaeia archaeon]|nr:ATP-binding protein [Candidatus Bathyarchaeia archaeon]